MPQTTANLERVATRTRLGNMSCLGADDSENTNRILIAQARASLIREALADDYGRLVLFAESGLFALDVENDHDVVRMFDQLAKVVLSAADNVAELITLHQWGILREPIARRP
jgi:hypothetical protein